MQTVGFVSFMLRETIGVSLRTEGASCPHDKSTSIYVQLGRLNY